MPQKRKVLNALRCPRCPAVIIVWKPTRNGDYICSFSGCISCNECQRRKGFPKRIKR